MDDLTRQALIGLGKSQLGLAAVLFGSAGTLAWGAGWLFFWLFLAGNLGLSLYFLSTDRALVQRRMRVGPSAETEPSQQRIMSFAVAAGLSVIVVPGLDHRFGWSSPPTALALVGSGLFAAGYAMVFLVLRENSHAASTIRVEPYQKLVDTGPYAWVRHPMYAGALVAVAGVPLILGSWWGEIAALALAAAIVLRLLDEERLLQERLPGYRDYVSRVRRRLIPGLW
jgi:protein-S-isoprenylcysteine O-methyltransferase Ste14